MLALGFSSHKHEIQFVVLCPLTLTFFCPTFFLSSTICASNLSILVLVPCLASVGWPSIHRGQAL